jgi:hypothetical protein
MRMAAPQSILDTNEDDSIPHDTRHKWGWQHPGRYSTQIGMAAPRSILDTNGDGSTPVNTPLETNGDGSTLVDTRHKWG